MSSFRALRYFKIFKMNFFSISIVLLVLRDFSFEKNLIFDLSMKKLLKFLDQTKNPKIDLFWKNSYRNILTLNA